MDERFGLITTSMEQVPLSGVCVTGEIVGRGARVKVAQRFRNAERAAVEAVYRFPLPESGAICGFRALVDGRRIAGAVEEREKAFEIYDKAVSEGHGGFLLDQERPNIFTMSVGNLAPGAEAVVEIEYALLLDQDGPETRFTLPTTIAPRYVPADMGDEGGIPAGDPVHPVYADRVPYGLAISLSVHDAASVESVASPSHAIRVAMGAGRIGVSFTGGEARMDRDFVLTISRRVDGALRAWHVGDGKRTYVQMDLSVAAEEAAAGAGREGRRGKEIVFLLDCSGSMQGDSIGQARRALDVCLKALASGSTFNIVRFGSTFESLFPRPEAYGERTLGEALGWLSRVDADLGGTEVLPPLRNVYGSPLAGDMERNVILLTDGEVGNEAEVAALVRANAEGTRFFCIGIGAGPNEHLIRSLARAGRGGSAFIFPGERIEPKMLSLFQAVLEAQLSNLRIEWGAACVQAPSDPTVLSGQASTVFARMDGEPAAEVRVFAELAGRPVAWTVPLAAAEAGSPPIPVLWARERIRELEETQGDAGRRGSRQELIALSKELGLLSRETSYVAVEEREEKDRTTGEVVLRKVPSLVTVGWHGRGSLAGAGATTGMAQAAMSCMPAPAPMTGLLRTVGVKADGKRKASMRRDARPGTPLAMALGDADDTGLLLRLLSLQRAGGGFDLDRETAAALGLDWTTFEAACRNAAGPPEEVLCALGTAVVLEVLARRFGGRKGEWAAAVRKSRDWLARSVKERALAVGGAAPQDWAGGFVKDGGRA